MLFIEKNNRKIRPNSANANKFDHFPNFQNIPFPIQFHRFATNSIFELNAI